MSDKSRKSKKADAKVEKEVPLEATDDILIEDVAAAEAEIKANDEKVKDNAKSSKKDVDAEKTKNKEKLPKVNFKWSNVDPIIMVSFVVFMLACVIVIGNTVYDKTLADHTEPNAEYGDALIVNYTGSFYAYYDETGAVVFDTTLSSVGNDDKYVKSWEYSKTSFSTITVTIGNGTYLSMFEDALIGHHPGETVRVLIPAKNGYGELTDSQIGTTNATAGTVLSTEKYTSSDYKTFFGVSAPSSTAGMTIVKSPYGWDATVVTGTDGMVSVQYNVKNGETYEMNEYVSVKVTSVGETIGFTYIISDKAPADHQIQIILEGAIVYITDIDGDVFTYKTTNEKTGIDLYFTIEFVKYAETES